MKPKLPSHVLEDQSEAFAFLADPSTHGLKSPVHRIDTHGAAVFLAGDHVYKVKRAVHYPFMDFSTLARRKAACEAEIEINRMFAPRIYLETLPITRSDTGLKLGGDGHIIEWTVHMRRFDENLTLDRLAESGALPRNISALLAPVAVKAHTQAPLRLHDDGTASLIRCAEENRAGLEEFPWLFAPDQIEQRFSRIMEWIKTLQPLLNARSRTGFVRRCHGDMHLRNIALIDGLPVLFDAIEFNDEIATSDILYDLAFLLMDLWERSYPEAANQVFCRYLWYGHRENLGALGAMPLFLSLRAAIRAKVSAAALSSLPDSEHPAMEASARRYFEFAKLFLRRPEPRLLAIGGLSGSGKSRLAADLAPHIGPAPGAFVLRSDIERKIQAGAEETERLDSSFYSQEHTENVYHALRQKAQEALEGGWPVIVDAVHATPDERNAIADIAKRFGLPFHGLWLAAPVSARTTRVTARKRDASDADAAIAEKQDSYETGQIDWQVIDAGGSPEQTLDHALETLQTSKPPKTAPSQPNRH